MLKAGDIIQIINCDGHSEEYDSCYGGYYLGDIGIVVRQENSSKLIVHFLTSYNQEYHSRYRDRFYVHPKEVTKIGDSNES
jgi:hypothetical protein